MAPRIPTGPGRADFMIAYGDSNMDDTFYSCHGIIGPRSHASPSASGMSTKTAKPRFS